MADPGLAGHGPAFSRDHSRRSMRRGLHDRPSPLRSPRTPVLPDPGGVYREVTLPAEDKVGEKAVGRHRSKGRGLFMGTLPRLAGAARVPPRRYPSPPAWWKPNWLIGFTALLGRDTSGSIFWTRTPEAVSG